MTIYTTYQCSVCRRTKDVEQDRYRVAPAHCIITKGCNGALYKIGETLNKSFTDAVAGLTDWYPRGEKITVRKPATVQEFRPLSTSDAGSLTIAVKRTAAFVADTPELDVVFRERLVADIPYTEYTFTVKIADSTISGKDNTGKNLRFGPTAAANGQVKVVVDGVLRELGLGLTDFQTSVSSPNTISFNSALRAGAIVSVTVFSQPVTTLVNMRFIRNDLLQLAAFPSAWGNIRLVDEYVKDSATNSAVLGGSLPDAERWWIYTATTSAVLSPNAQYQLEMVVNANTDAAIFPSPTGLSDEPFANMRFLLSAKPHGHSDRILNAFVNADAVDDNYPLKSANTGTIELLAPKEHITDINPPLQFIEVVASGGVGSYISPDVLNFSSADVAKDLDELQAIATPKTIGPV